MVLGVMPCAIHLTQHHYVCCNVSLLKFYNPWVIEGNHHLKLLRLGPDLCYRNSKNRLGMRLQIQKHVLDNRPPVCLSVNGRNSWLFLLIKTI